RSKRDWSSTCALPIFLKLIHHAFNSGYLHYVYETSSSLKPQFEPNILYVFQSMYFHAFDLYMKELIQIETKKHFQSEKKTIQYKIGRASCREKNKNNT